MLSTISDRFILTGFSMASAKWMTFFSSITSFVPLEQAANAIVIAAKDAYIAFISFFFCRKFTGISWKDKQRVMDKMMRIIDCKLLYNNLLRFYGNGHLKREGESSIDECRCWEFVSGKFKR